jgi:hypothetical protein
MKCQQTELMAWDVTVIAVAVKIKLELGKET